jgi:microsomal epoxide hydrolase
MSTTIETATALRPFRVDVPGEQIDDLPRRIAGTRWPSRSWSTTDPRAYRCRRTRYWLGEYDFGVSRGDATRCPSSRP